MILDVDIGNSFLKWRLAGTALRGGSPVADLAGMARELEGQGVARVRAGCVAGPDVEDQFSLWCQRVFGVAPEYARVARRHAGLSVAYTEHQKLGVDRWLAMLGARQRVAGAFAVVDAGSALTADFVNSRGEHLGGLILPGARLMVDALFTGTHSVQVDTLTVPQKWQPGRDTLACVENGLAAAINGVVREVVDYGEKYGGAGLPILICGGDAGLLCASTRRLTLAPDLVLDGLAEACG